MIPRLSWAILFAYILCFGGLWRGVAVLEFSRLILVVILAVWSAWHITNRWRWHGTRLDLSILAWGVVLIVSSVANLGRVEIAVGLWWMIVYAVLWFMLNDMIANGIDTDAMLDGLLIGTIPLLILAAGQLLIYKSAIFATLENQNYAGSLFAITTGVALARKRYKYSVASALMVLATGSRGGLIMLLIYLALWLRIKWWQIAVGGVVVIGAALLMRGFTGREVYWQDALTQVEARPLTGSGIYTYRHPDYIETRMIHIHPHNLPLLIAVEHGLPGLLALAFMIFQMVGAARSKYAFLLIGIGVYALVDVVLMQPAQAMIFIVVLSVISREIGREIPNANNDSNLGRSHGFLHNALCSISACRPIV
jgi:hypothetical protein